MTNSPTTISPRRRSLASEAPSQTVSAPTPSNEIDTPPRVLIRLPAIATLSPKPVAKPAAAPQAGSSPLPSAAAIPSSAPWYARLQARLDTPPVKKYLPYTLAVVVAFGMFFVMRSHSNKSRPVAADSDAPAWINTVALPPSQIGGHAQAGTSNLPNWNAPAWPPANGAAPGVSPGAAGNSPSAYQSAPGYANPSVPSPNPASTSSFQSNVAPTTGWPRAGAPPNNATGGFPGARGDSVPPMPARSPAWPGPAGNPAGNPPSNPVPDPGVVQNGVAGPTYRTAQANDPAAIPPGRSPNDASEAGSARFQGMITPPPQ